MAFNVNYFDNVSSGASRGPRIWSYGSTTDTLATITASGYFDDVKFRINLNDLIYVSGSDGVEQLKVTSENGATATTTTYIPASGGAPNSATYIVQTANPDLPNEQALAALATGIVKNATTTGVLSIAVAGTDYYAPGGTDIPVADGGTGVSTMTTAYAPVLAGTTATGPLQVADTGLSTAGWVLTSNGSSAKPSFQASAGGVTSVTGTTNRITSSGGATPAIDISASYVGQSSITTVGTITSGVWTGTNVAVTSGGTGLATMTTAYAPVCAGTTATGALQVASTGLATAGFVLTSNGSSAVPSFQALPAGGMTWANISGTTQAAAINTGYVVGNSSATTITLPATAALGSVIAVQGKGAAGWILAANTGQTIQVGQTATSSAGTVTSAGNFDAIQVVCITANTTWAVSYVLSSGVTTT